MIVIDGSHGEGGGQILRTAVALSAITGKSCKIENIRANRKNPGIQAQHLAAINAVAEVCNTRTTAKLGETELVFEPKEISGGHYDIDIGTAGSISLVIQAVSLPSIHAKHTITLNISGGTHVNWSPSIDYMRHVFTYFLEKLGVDIDIEMKKCGFYPKGGGNVFVKIEPGKLKPVDITKKGNILNRGFVSVASRSLEGVAERQAPEGFQIKEIIYSDSLSPGSCITCYETYENCRIGTSVLGEKGKKAGIIGKEVSERLEKIAGSDCCLDEHMADQILPFLAFSGGSVRVEKLTEHAKTNMWVIEKFLPVKFKIDGNVISAAF